MSSQRNLTRPTVPKMERFKFWLGSRNTLNASCTVKGCDYRMEFEFEHGMIDAGQVANALDAHDCLSDG